MNCNVIIIDDHPLVSRGLSQLIESQRDYKVIGMAKNRNEALTLLDNTTPDLAIVDLNLGQEDGLELIKDIIVIHPQTKILVLSMHDERFYAERAIKAGAKGFLTVDSESSELVQAIYTIRGGHDYYSESITHILLQKYINNMNPNSSNETEEYDDTSSALSSRQIEILRLWGDGLTNQEIADTLFISVRTVETHKNHIMQKLNLKSSVDLMKFAIRNNIITV